MTDPATSCPTTSYDYAKRIEFGTSGAAIFAYPSTGGIIVKEPAETVDFESLNLNRFRSSTRADDQVEDEFCKRLKMVGGKWWSSQERYTDVLLGEHGKTEEEEEMVVLGWPEEDQKKGGVWILRFKEKEKPRDFGKLYFAMNMTEKCEIIMEFGGTFHDYAEDVAYLWLK